jgi:oxygen-independent coproporphyrinogen-3 oxidase
MQPKTEEKYNVAVPRYTSYPTVPYWDSSTFTPQAWAGTVINTFNDSADNEGISLYIHLPFCESLCTYCGCNTRITKNHKVEVPYIKAVLQEWQMYVNILGKKPTIKELHLGGGTPTFFSPENLQLLISGILEQSKVHENASFSFEGHPGNTSPTHLATLYKLGFKRLSLGIQDFDPRVQLVINRIQTYEEVEQITSIARSVGYNSINYDLIYGLPLQTLQGLTETIEAVLMLKPDRIAFYSYAHVPWVKPGQRRYTEKDLPDAALKQSLYETGRNMLKAGGYEEIGMDHFTLKSDSIYIAAHNGQLHRNFMGYSDQYSSLMIGLGVSAISDSWSGFAQNEKTVETYLELVNKGELPVFKGHLSNAEDLILRQHILNIMCKGQSSWVEPELQCTSLFEGLDRMEELAADGLVEIKETSLTVTATGKRYLRNICMTLDARLWANKPTTQLFSMAG